MILNCISMSLNRAFSGCSREAHRNQLLLQSQPPSSPKKKLLQIGVPTSLLETIKADPSISKSPLEAWAFQVIPYHKDSHIHQTAYSLSLDSRSCSFHCALWNQVPIISKTSYQLPLCIYIYISLMKCRCSIECTTEEDTVSQCWCVFSSTHLQLNLRGMLLPHFLLSLP